MKYVKYALIILSFLCATANVSALSCKNSDAKDLGQYASYVRTNYEIVDKSVVKDLYVGDDATTYLVPRFDFEISIYNIVKEIYITINDDVTNRTLTVTNADTQDGIFSFLNSDFGSIYNYTINVYSAHSDCYGEKIRTLSFVKPMYNPYSEYTFCQNSSVLYCQRFVTANLGIASADEFLNKIKVNNEQNAPTIENETVNKIGDILREHWLLYLSIFVAVVIITIIIIIVMHKRKAKAGWRL